MDFFQYGFMQRAFFAGIIIAIICPLVGIFLVLRRMSMIGDTLSHISMSGVAVGLLTGISPTISTIITCLLGSIAIEFFRKNYCKYAELAIAITMSSGIGIAVLLVSMGKLNNATVMSYLFGSLVTTTTYDIWLIVAIGLLVIISVGILYPKLFYMTFDEEAAYYAGVNTNLANAIFMLLTALTVAVSIRIVGILLVSPLMTIPVATSFKLAKNFKSSIIISILLALTSVVSGIIISYYLDAAPGGTIVIIALSILVISILIEKIRKLNIIEFNS